MERPVASHIIEEAQLPTPVRTTGCRPPSSSRFMKKRLLVKETHNVIFQLLHVSESQMVHIVKDVHLTLLFVHRDWLHTIDAHQR